MDNSKVHNSQIFIKSIFYSKEVIVQFCARQIHLDNYISHIKIFVHYFFNYVIILQGEPKQNSKTQACLCSNKGLENRCNYCYRIISLCHPIIIFHFVYNHRLFMKLLNIDHCYIFYSINNHTFYEIYYFLSN